MTERANELRAVLRDLKDALGDEMICMMPFMRAREPDSTGTVERSGVKVAYQVFGSGAPTILLLPTWSIVHSRFWKAQVPYLARHFRVVTFDGRGNGESDRPADPAGYAEAEFVADAVAVLDATGTDRAVVVGISLGCTWAALLGADHPERVLGLILSNPSSPLGESLPDRLRHDFDAVLETDEGWAKYNRHSWLRDYRAFLEFFAAKCFTEPHSTKQIEDFVGWGLDTTAPALVATADAPSQLFELGANSEAAKALYGRIRCPVLVVHGDEDEVISHSRGAAVAQATGGRLVTIVGGGHLPPARDPVKFNLLVRDFAEPFTPRAPVVQHWTRGRRRRKRALYISSPIGLGHAQRDVAIAAELRKLHPDLEIDWLAQHPVTRVLQEHGERIHPASVHLASESAHIEGESAEHDLHCFQALRRMDEILVANFMLFHDVVTDSAYDLWIGDEAWELDYFLHENPELKRAPYAWMTDFVGFLPMPDGGNRESMLTADYNAEMIEHIARYPALRDRAIFVGNPDDVVPDGFGPDLPMIRSWTEEHFDFSGYVTGFDPAAFADREALRAELGYRPDEKVCIVTVGGSSVGTHLLRRVVAAYGDAKRRIPELRMIVVAGPRIDPASLPNAEGLEVRGYVKDLYRHLAGCDLAVVQGGLTTTMELTANRRPFLYFPLRHHFEQNFHVRHRLNRYAAGRCMDFETATPEIIALAIAEELRKPIDYRPVESDGAIRAAKLIAALL